MKHGKVISGVLGDEAMIRFNRFPAMEFEERMELIRGIEGVSEVVVQDEIMYNRIIEKLHPDYVIHGDNWIDGPMRAIRDNVKQLLEGYGGQVIEVPCTYNENTRRVEMRARERLRMPEYRRKRLKRLLKLCPIVKVLEVHSEIGRAHV